LLRRDTFILTLYVFYNFFFFSSRRRHTRLVSDWSSDVCSSDLLPAHLRQQVRRARASDRCRVLSALLRSGAAGIVGERGVELKEIGRASCRERVEIWVGGV